MKPRVFLGRDQNLAGYRRVYEIEDGLEVDENSFVEIERTRVYFDDVLGMTYHRQMGVGFLIFTGLFALFLGALTLAVAVENRGEPVAALVLGCFTLPFVAAFVLRLALKVDVITVFGKRTMASMKFGFRKERAREIYRDLSRKIRACQEKAAASLPKPPAPPEAPLPPSFAPPPEGASEGKPAPPPPPAAELPPVPPTPTI